MRTACSLDFRHTAEQTLQISRGRQTHRSQPQNVMKDVESPTITRLSLGDVNSPAVYAPHLRRVTQQWHRLCSSDPLLIDRDIDIESIVFFPIKHLSTLLHWITDSNSYCC